MYAFAFLFIRLLVSAQTPGKEVKSQAKLAASREGDLVPGGQHKETETRYCAHLSFKY